jgi:hypothetical protein
VAHNSAFLETGWRDERANVKCEKGQRCDAQVDWETGGWEIKVHRNDDRLHGQMRGGDNKHGRNHDDEQALVKPCAYAPLPEMVTYHQLCTHDRTKSNYRT